MEKSYLYPSQFWLNRPFWDGHKDKHELNIQAISPHLQFSGSSSSKDKQIVVTLVAIQDSVEENKKDQREDSLRICGNHLNLAVWNNFDHDADLHCGLSQQIMTEDV